MRTAILVVGLLLSSMLFAQNDSAFREPFQTYGRITTLTRSEIERLPVYSFLELIQGAFPFVASESMIEEQYCFVVNGFLSVNPNSINVSQIETISFFPAGIDITRGSLTKKGSFVITLKTEGNGFNVSTKTGIVFENKKRNLDLAKSRGGFATFNEFSYSHHSNRWTLSSAISFLKNKNPDDTYVSAFSTGIGHTEMRRLRLANFGEYIFNSHLKIEGGLFLTLQPENSSQSSSLQIAPAYDYKYESNSKNKLSYSGTHVAVCYAPNSQLKNQFMAEGTFSKDVLNRSSGSVFTTNPNQQSYSFTGRYNSCFISDVISWQTKQSNPAQLTFSVFARYGKWHSPEKSNISSSTDPNNNYSFSVTKKSKSLLINPTANFSWKQILFARASAYCDTYSNTLFNKNQNQKILPDAGLKIDLSSFLGKSFVSSLKVSANYSKYITAIEANDAFENQSLFSPVPSGSYLLYVDPGMQGKYPPVENWVSSLSIGLHNEAFILNVHYRKFEKIIRAYVAVASGANFTTYGLIMEPINVKGWCFEVSSSILEQEKTKLKIYAMVFQDNYSIKYPVYPSPYDVVFADAGKAPWRGGIRTSLSINRFFMQGSLLADFRVMGVDKNNSSDDDVNSFNNNFLVAGYSMPIKSRRIKTFEISAQSNNAFYSRPYFMQSYAGLGAKLTF